MGEHPLHIGAVRARIRLFGEVAPWMGEDHSRPPAFIKPRSRTIEALKNTRLALPHRLGCGRRLCHPIRASIAAHAGK
jgi:hypothetical protein